MLIIVSGAAVITEAESTITESTGAIKESGGNDNESALPKRVNWAAINKKSILIIYKDISQINHYKLTINGGFSILDVELKCFINS